MSRLVIILLLYLCIFGLVHLHLLVKTRRAFYLHGVRYFLLATVLLFLMLAPIQARVLEAQGHWLPALIMAWIGNCWLGFVFLFFCLALPLDAYHMVVRAFQGITGADCTGIMLSRRQNLGFIVTLACGFMIYGAFEAHHIRTERITLTSPKLPPEVHRLRLVQISDLHLGPMTFPGRMVPVVKAVRAAKPDILVSTGDLIDGILLDREAVSNALRDLPAPMGKYAILGNHEYYHGFDASLKFVKECGFTLLKNQTRSVNPHLTIAGVDDAAGRRYTDKSHPQEADLLKTIPKGPFVVLLKHRPRIDPMSEDLFDLQLSGHIHGGQIFPFDYLVRLSYPMTCGLNRLATGNHLYTNRGTGTWGPPIRLLAPPEVTVIDLVPARPIPGSKAQ